MDNNRCNVLAICLSNLLRHSYTYYYNNYYGPLIEMVLFNISTGVGDHCDVVML